MEDEEKKRSYNTRYNMSFIFLVIVYALINLQFKHISLLVQTNYLQKSILLFNSRSIIFIKTNVRDDETGM